MGRALSAASLVAMLVLLLGLFGCGGGSDSTTGVRDQLNPEDYVPEVQVQEVDHRYRIAGWTQENLDDDPIFDLINSATNKLDIAIAKLDRQAVVAALVAKKQATPALQIRVLTEKAYYDDDAYKPFYSQLETAGIPVRTDKEGLPRVMHARFMIIDDSRVVTGSYNWESRDADYTFGDVITFMNTNIALAFTSQFNQMYEEGLFGVDKRNASLHSFIVGYTGGRSYGQVEVYFGPTDQTRDLMESEIGASSNVIFAVQQFTDQPLANFLLSWLGAVPEATLVGICNNVGTVGGQAENNVYGAFLDYLAAPTGGQLYINGVGPQDATNPAAFHPLDYTGNFDYYATMNHKLMFADHAGGTPSMIFTTSNYTDMGFTQNDEVMLIFRGESLVRKFWRGINFQSPMPPDELQVPQDAQELDQLMAMFPYMSTPDTAVIRSFDQLPCGIIYGEVANFKRSISVDAGDGTFTDILIDVNFEVGTATNDTLFFGGTLDFGPVWPEGTDNFIENELINPNHKYLMVVPAGKITVRTNVISDSGEASAIFEPQETTFEIGPGCIKKVNLAISQANTTGTGGGTGA